MDAKLKEKECATEDVLANVYSSLFILDVLVADEGCSAESKINHMGVLIEQMMADIQKLKKYYDVLDFLETNNTQLGEG